MRNHKGKLKIGQIVRLVFLDHCKDETGDVTPAIEFEVIGRITDLTKEVAVVRVWGAPDDLSHDENTESFSIVRACISKAEILRSK